MRERFWERLPLGELTKDEWEALCDGCGQCCLLRHLEPDTVTVYGVACELLDIQKAQCADYPQRLDKAPGCHQLTPENVPKYDWLPGTCAYRLVDQGKPLPTWHPLLTGSRREMLEQGITVSHYALPSREVPRHRLEWHIVDFWPRGPKRRDAAGFK